MTGKAPILYLKISKPPDGGCFLKTLWTRKGACSEMIGRISGQYSMDALSGKKSRKNVYTDGFSAGSDEASFSPFAVQMARIDAELKNVPDVREDVVNHFKEQVESGAYVPPLDKVAHSLVMAGMLNAE